MEDLAVFVTLELVGSEWMDPRKRIGARTMTMTTNDVKGAGTSESTKVLKDWVGNPSSSLIWGTILDQDLVHLDDLQPTHIGDDRIEP